MLNKLITLSSRLLLPYCCLLCETSISENYLLCQECQALLTDNLSRCQQCAYPCNGDYCGQCLKQPPAFDQTHTLGSYEYSLRLLLSQLKFYERLAVSKALGRLMAESFKALERPECLIPIPLHRTRLRKRGYNQALELAKVIHQQLDIPLDYQNYHRHKATAPQATLAAKHRKKNVTNAFSVKHPIAYQHVAIIDDVITTGETANAFAKLLKQHGVQKVQLWCAARTQIET